MKARWQRFLQWFFRRAPQPRIQFELDRGFVLSEAGGGKRWQVRVEPGDGVDVPFGQVRVSVLTRQDEVLRNARFDRIAAVVDAEEVPGAIEAAVRDADRARAAHQAAWEHGWRP